MKSPTVFVFAPQGAGKTANAEALRAMFGCTSVMDDWEIGSGSFIPDGALVLSSLLPYDLIEYGRKTRGNFAVQPVEVKAEAAVAGSSSLVDAVDLMIKLSNSLIAFDPKRPRDVAEYEAKKRLLAMLSDADVLRCAALIEKAAAGSNSL